jgi:hypothetical protein
MQHLLLVTIFVLISWLPISAQAQSAQPACPKIGITGPSERTRPGDKAVFTVTVPGEEPGKFKYNWHVSAGSIEGGLDSPTLTVRSANAPGTTITATVEIEGLPAGCPNTASEGASVQGCGDPAVFDEYERIPFRVEKKWLKNAVIKFRGQAGSRLLFTIYRPRNTVTKSDKKREADILKYLKGLGVRKDQVSFVYGKRDSYLTRIFFVPTKDC